MRNPVNDVTGHGSLHSVRPQSPGAVAFARTLSFADMPDEVVRQAQRCLLDLLGVAAGGASTRAAATANTHAATQMTSRVEEARLLFDGRSASRAGAAFAGASTIDALDAHDGHVLTKGHAGVAVLPALLAMIDAGAECDGREFLACLAIGYEIGTRAGIALHASVDDYHCSGAWNALGCAAVAGRLLRLDEGRLEEALGIAEYIAPRGQILRVCSHPTMLKDGSGWGAHAGVTAALLAQDGFTGGPAVTVDGDAGGVWHDLGQRWRIREQYFKAYPVCRWAQPAMEAALELRRAHRFDADDIETIEIESFREAIDLGSGCAVPANTEQAQYSLPYAVCAALAFDHVGASEISDATVRDPQVRRLLACVALREDRDFSSRFPAERWARVRIALGNGHTLVSQPARARGNPENPLSDDELLGKYRTLAIPVLGEARSSRIENGVEALAFDATALRALREDLLSPMA